MSANLGLLMVMMQPPPHLEEEFNAWYDTEHLPERVVLPGFLSGLRFVCVDGYPRYMALYDMDDEAVIESEPYCAISGPHFSPWTKRVTRHMPVYRVVARQVAPGAEATKRSSSLVIARLRDIDPAREAGIAAALKEIGDVTAGVTQIRLFAGSQPTADHFVMIGLEGASRSPIALHEITALRGHIDIVNTYVPYNPAADDNKR